MNDLNKGIKAKVPCFVKAHFPKDRQVAVDFMQRE